MEEEDGVTDEATPTTIERGYARTLTLPVEVSTTTVLASVFFVDGQAHRELKREAKASGSGASLTLGYEEHIETGLSGAMADRGVMGSHPSLATLRSRNAAAIALLDRWLADESGYDERTWPTLKKAIEESRTSKRKRFRD